MREKLESKASEQREQIIYHAAYSGCCIFVQCFTTMMNETSQIVVKHLSSMLTLRLIELTV